MSVVNSIHPAIHPDRFRLSRAKLHVSPLSFNLVAIVTLEVGYPLRYHHGQSEQAANTCLLAIGQHPAAAFVIPHEE